MSLNTYSYKEISDIREDLDKAVIDLAYSSNNYFRYSARFFFKKLTRCLELLAPNNILKTMQIKFIHDTVKSVKPFVQHLQKRRD